MAYGDFKDLNRRTADDKVLYDKVFNLAKNPEYHRIYITVGLLQWFIDVLIKKNFWWNS